MIEQIPTDQGKVRFGVFEADLRAGELRKSGIRIKLQSQPFSLLATLLAHPGEIVTREDLQQQIWGSETMVNFDHSLGTAVNKVREALGDSAENPRYIETLAKRGYRFIAPVQGVKPQRAPLPETKESPNATIRPWIPVICVMAGLSAGLAAGLLVSNLQHTPSPKAPINAAEVWRFWSSVLKSTEAPLLIFSNAEFNGRPETGLRYYNPKLDSHDHVNDLYTGVGEVLAVAELSRIFRMLNREIVVKRSGLLSWDETRSRDLIFAGSPTENPALRDLPLAHEFVFRPIKPGDPRAGDLAIMNEHPRAGEPPWFLASADLPLSEDYALLMLQPGFHSGQSVLLMAGTTTLGTQAAADFVSQNESLASLRKALGLAPRSPYTPFSAVIHVRIARGVPVETNIAAVHATGK